MLKKLIRITKRASNDQRGAILALALILFALGVIMVVPLLGFMASGFKSTDQVYDRKANELYAADAGVREAIWNMKNNPFMIPQKEEDAAFVPSVDLNLNNKSVDYSISFVGTDHDASGRLLKIYRIDSIARSPDNQNTAIISYAIQPLGKNNNIFENAVASGAGMDFKKESIVIDGPIAYKTGSEPDDGYLYYDADGDGVVDPIPPPDPALELPGEQANLAFANAYKAVAEAGGTVGTTIITSGNLGPLYVTGDLTIKGSVTLTGPVYIDGSLNFDKGGILNGQGVIIARDNISCKKENTLSANPDTEIFFMALTGDIDLRKGQKGYNAIFYAPQGSISFKKEQTITGAAIAGDGFSADMGLSVTYKALNEENILPGYVASNPQLQTWDITVAD